MKTSTVNVHDREITINEKFVPGLVAGGVIYWCDDHEAYHLRDDHNEARALKIVEMAAECNGMTAWADGQPLDPRDGEIFNMPVLKAHDLKARLVGRGMDPNSADRATMAVKRDLLRPVTTTATIGDFEFTEYNNGHWGRRVFSTTGDFLWSSGGGWWEGEAEPQLTGRVIKYSSLIDLEVVVLVN